MTVRAKWIALLLLLVIWTGLGAWLLMDTNEPQRVPLKFIAGQSGVGGTSAHANAATRIDLALLMAQRQKVDNAFMALKPPTPASLIAASDPPATKTSALFQRI